MPAGTRVVVALSGGADSMALVHLLKELEEAGDCHLVGIAHLNHGLRGRAADEDEAFCRLVASQLDLPFDSERVDVASLARERGISVEHAGHDARYAFFARVAERQRADRVALGHTRDDQAETVLLRLVRGAGPRGLAGMYPRAGIVIRPLLECARADLRAFVAERGLAFREDETNQDTRVPRNRVRHDVLPVLSALSPRIVRTLARESIIAREDADLLDQLAGAGFTQWAADEDGIIKLSLAELDAAPAAIARRVVARAMQLAAADRFVGFDHVQAALDLARSQTSAGSSRHLPGVCAERVGGYLVLRPNPRNDRRRPGKLRSGTNSFRFSLSIPGEACSPDGWTVSAERRPLDPSTRESIESGRISPACAVLDAELVGAPLTVRSWRPGDRMRPLGLAGTKKLQDVFVDRKVPRDARGRVPLVVDGADRVVWVAGQTIAEDFRVTAATFDVVILKLGYWRNGT